MQTYADNRSLFKPAVADHRHGRAWSLYVLLQAAESCSSWFLPQLRLQQGIPETRNFAIERAKVSRFAWFSASTWPSGERCSRIFSTPQQSITKTVEWGNRQLAGILHLTPKGRIFGNLAVRCSRKGIWASTVYSLNDRGFLRSIMYLQIKAE